MNGIGIVGLGTLVWVSISVGPWWIGLVIFLFGMILNLAGMVNKERDKK